MAHALSLKLAAPHRRGAKARRNQHGANETQDHLYDLVFSDRPDGDRHRNANESVGLRLKGIKDEDEMEEKGDAQRLWP